jgi:hypothetical protein
MSEKNISRAIYKEVMQMANYGLIKQPFHLLHIPNEQRPPDNSTAQARMKVAIWVNHLKSLGFVPGCADLLLLYKNGWGAIEVKADEKSLKAHIAKSLKLQDSTARDQKMFADKTNEMQMPYLITYNVAVAVNFVLDLLGESPKGNGDTKSKQ